MLIMLRYCDVALSTYRFTSSTLRQNPTSHPSAFINSTFIDLQDERDFVAKGIQDCGLIVNALEVKPASNNTSRAEILKGIQESDFVILIITDRFGSIVPKITNSQ